MPALRQRIAMASPEKPAPTTRTARVSAGIAGDKARTSGASVIGRRLRPGYGI
ncbi:hypothetical protein MPOCJGCO_4633 [Methylobacterium trifolii]|uniref:Uncharacterized protein n=1 Tax=Methylobacterium trifolii TaxID=1003092 RepID=A0ABQ4U502_9HYPH|nr:hypothetical protein MPOCJGCO_4633 [Methylobacterium trifolii]